MRIDIWALLSFPLVELLGFCCMVSETNSSYHTFILECKLKKFSRMLFYLPWVLGGS